MYDVRTRDLSDLGQDRLNNVDSVFATGIEEKHALLSVTPEPVSRRDSTREEASCIP